MPVDIAFSDDTPSTIQAVTITAVVRNDGGADSSGGLVRFYDGASLIGTGTLPPLSVRGGLGSVSIAATLPTVGNHDIRVVLDPDNVIAETNEANNERTEPLLLHAPAPDLAPSGISLSKPVPVTNEVVNVSVTVRNQGERASGAFDVQFKRDDDTIAIVTVVGLDIGEETTLSVPISFGASGLHGVTVVVDLSDDVAELSESNNIATASVNVLPAPLSDLKVSAAELDVSDTNPQAGETVTVTVPVRNVGDAPAGEVVVDLMIDGVVVQSLVAADSANPIPLGGSTTVTLTFTAPSADGYHLLEVVADPGNSIGETNENNNRAFRLFLIGPAPDLVVSGISFSNPAPVEGEVVSVSATVENVGLQDATGVVVNFYDGSELIGQVTGLNFLLSGTTSRVVTVPYSTFGRSGDRTIKVVVDPADAIPEINEGNNLVSIVYRVAPGANSVPVVANAISDVTVTEDAPATVLDLTDTFDDGDLARGDSLTLSLAGNTNPGLVTASLNGTTLVLSYAPDANGTATITVRATDEAGDFVQDNFVVTVTPVNDVPTGVAEAYEMDEGTTLNVPPVGVLLNDADPDGDSLTAVLAAGPASGTLTLNSNGSFAYTPADGFSGTVTFSYRASDGELTSDPTTVSIVVNSINASPVAMDDSYATDEDHLLLVSATGVLGNDGDPDGDPLSATLDAGPALGVLTLHPDGSFSYDPDGQFESLAAGETATQSFRYTVSDGQGGTATATVTITIVGVNDAPSANTDTATAGEDDMTVAIAVLANDTDVDASDTLTVSSTDTAGTIGSVSITPDGLGLVYRPEGRFEHLAAGETATDTFRYTISDGQGGTATATVTVIITGVNDAPNGSGDSYTTAEDSALTIDAVAGVLINDSDVDGTALTAVLDGGPNHAASFTLNNDGSFSYTPTANFAGTDRFTYRISDGQAESDPVEVVIVVTEVNDTPERTGGTIRDMTVAEDAAATSLGLADLSYAPEGRAPNRPRSSRTP